VAFVTCSLGTIDAGETVTTRVSARVTQRGTHRNTTTVTGSGGRETNPADNVDDATTVVPHCLELAISPRTIRADGERHRITVTVTVLTTPVRRTRIRVRGSGVHEVATTNAEGVARLTVVPTEAGFLTVETFQTRRPLCAIERIRVTRPERAKRRSPCAAGCVSDLREAGIDALSVRSERSCRCTSVVELFC
jgi:hypothetical protein